MLAWFSLLIDRGWHRSLGQALLALITAYLIVVPRVVPALEIRIGDDGVRIVGAGKTAEEVRNLGAFTAVSVDGPIDVVLKPGTAERVTLRADANVLPQIKTEIHDGVLQIGMKPSVAVGARIDGRMTATIDFIKLNAVTLRAAGDLKAERIDTDLFEATITGSGNVQIDQLKTETLAAFIKGSGNFSASGAANRQGFVIQGSGDIRCRDLAGKHVAVRIRGSGDADIRADETLEAEVSGSGDVTYWGKPVVTKRIRGSGEVRAARN